MKYFLIWVFSGLLTLPITLNLFPGTKVTYLNIIGLCAGGPISLVIGVAAIADRTCAINCK